VVCAAPLKWAVGRWIRAADPELALACSMYDSGSRGDPWGRPWLKLPKNPGAVFADTYSAGPNGRDEGGLGDDVLHNRYLTNIWISQRLACAHWLLPLVAGVLALWVPAARILRRGPTHWQWEVLGGTAVAAVLAGSLFLGAFFLPKGVLSWGASLLRGLGKSETLLAPPEVALVGTLALAGVGAVVGLRLRARRRAVEACGEARLEARSGENAASREVP
jgi:hypothetical protein